MVETQGVVNNNDENLANRLWKLLAFVLWVTVILLLAALLYWYWSKQVQPLDRGQRELAEFFGSKSVGLHSVGPDGTILWASQAELDLLGYGKEEYVGQNIVQFHVDQAVIVDILTRLKLGETLTNIEATLRCKDGSIKRVVIDSSVVWQEGKFLHTRCFTRPLSR